MKKIISIIFLVAFLSGCAGMITKWECPDNSCVSYERASNKCLAQANTAFSRNKRLIWEQCMKGEGFNETPCAPGETRSNPGCKVFHIF
jgi:hypothetical protein